MDILNLPNLEIIDVKEKETGFYITAKTTTETKYCLACSQAAKLSKYGTKEQIIMDSPIRGKPVGIKLIRQRYKCKGCGYTFWEWVTDIDEKRSATKRLIKYVCEHSLERTFASISREVGLDEKTVRNIFADHVKGLDKEYKIIMPRWLGIDEIHILKKNRALLTNIEDNTIIDFLSNRNKATLQDYFKTKGRKHIEFVTMDMWNPYRSVVREYTKAKIIVDKFHVVRTANYCLDLVRKSIKGSLNPKERRQLMNDRFLLLKRQKELDRKQQQTIETWFWFYPDLGNAYMAKESFYDIFDCNDRRYADALYQKWLGSLDSHTKDAFRPVITAMKNWHDEIMNYFDKPLTNAYTESLNNIIRFINRIGRGYSFDVLRAKILHTRNGQKIKRNTFQKQEFREDVLRDTSYSIKHTSLYTGIAEPTESYGVDISTLAQKIRNGELG